MLRRTAPAVLVTLLCALALFATTTATWIHADVPTSLQSVTVDVPGADAAPAGQTLAAQHPGATDTNDPENLRVLDITVRWATRTDASQVPPRSDELTLR